jgi:hypothetical protein
MAGARNPSHRISVLDGFDVNVNIPLGKTTTVAAGHPPAQPSSSEVRKIKRAQHFESIVVLKQPKPTSKSI